MYLKYIAAAFPQIQSSKPTANLSLFLCQIFRWTPLFYFHYFTPINLQNASLIPQSRITLCVTYFKCKDEFSHKEPFSQELILYVAGIPVGVPMHTTIFTKSNQRSLFISPTHAQNIHFLSPISFITSHSSQPFNSNPRILVDLEPCFLGSLLWKI